MIPISKGISVKSVHWEGEDLVLHTDEGIVRLVGAEVVDHSISLGEGSQGVMKVKNVELYPANYAAAVFPGAVSMGCKVAHQNPCKLCGQPKVVIDNLTERVAEGAARALWLCAWADYEEEHGRHYPGQELNDVAPDTPVEALYKAYRLIGEVECMNKESIFTIVQRACYADGVEYGDVEDDYLIEFGHYMAMESLGHGVSWFDRHAKFDIELPYICGLYLYEESENGT